MKSAGLDMSRPVYIAVHAVGAAVFMSALQGFVLHASTEDSLLWGLGFGAAAAGLAWRQTNR